MMMLLVLVIFFFINVTVKQIIIINRYDNFYFPTYLQSFKQQYKDFFIFHYIAVFFRVATGQAKSGQVRPSQFFFEKVKKVRPSQDFCGQNGQKSVF